VDEGWSINISVRRGQWTGRFEFECLQRWMVVRGPSGGGKSSLVRAIAGIGNHQGQIKIGDKRWTEATPAPQRRVGWCPQDSLLFPHLSVLENLRLAPNVDSAMHACERLEVAELLDRMPRSLSGGQRQRVAIARALGTSDDVLLLDEPLSALNSELRQLVLKTLTETSLENPKLHVLLVTHEVIPINVPHAQIGIEEGQLR
jgi:ABC-type sulfate/molybdate transport systems ATPase subunit